MPVNTQHADYKKFLPKWNRCRDVCAGADAVHEAGTKYLPMLQDQKPADYLKYVLRATFYNATWRTIAGLVGMIFRKPMKIDAPDAVKGVTADPDKGVEGEPGLLIDVDGAGLPFQLFTQKVTEEALKTGRVGVLVDYPKTPENYTQADAIANGLSPMMCFYDTFSIINWKVGKVNGKKVLTQVVLAETVWIEKDEFEGKEEDRWRVLDLMNIPTDPSQTDVVSYPVYRQRVYKLNIQKSTKGAKTPISVFSLEDTIFPKMNGMPMTYIPFKFIGVDDSSLEIDDPPLIDLVDMNLSHYRTTADHEHGCHFTALPTLVLTGWKKENPNDRIYLGSEAALVTPAAEAKASFCEFTGNGLKALTDNLERKEHQMAVLGARMLEKQIRGVESADTASIHRKGEESMLASVSVAISLGMTDVLKWFTEWSMQDSTGVKVELNRDFYPAPMTAQMLTALLAGWQQGAPGFSDQSLFEALKAGEIISEDADLEDEQARIASKQAEQVQQNIEMNDAMGLNPDGSPKDPAIPNVPPDDGSGKGGDVHIHVGKGSGKKTVTNEKTGTKYTIHDE